MIDVLFYDRLRKYFSVALFEFFFYNFLLQLHSTFDAFIASKSSYFNVIVFEYVYFESFANKSSHYRDGIGPRSFDAKRNVRLL